MNAAKVLDLGCGNKKRAGALGIDFNSRTAADVIHDLNVFPYPLESETFDKVYLANTLGAFERCYARDGGGSSDLQNGRPREGHCSLLQVTLGIH